jgi:hypothetical protein
MLFSYGLVNDKIDDDIKCTSITAHFKGLADAPVLCGVHHLMQHV